MRLEANVKANCRCKAQSSGTSAYVSLVKEEKQLIRRKHQRKMKNMSNYKSERMVSSCGKGQSIRSIQ